MPAAKSNAPYVSGPIADLSAFRGPRLGRPRCTDHRDMRNGQATRNAVLASVVVWLP
jgi:hypothetical protein